MNHEQVRGDPYNSDIPEWLQESRESLVEERVPEHRDSHASSSHEPSSQPMRSADLGKHSFKKSLPERPKLRDLADGPKLQVHRAEDVLAESYLLQKFLVIWLQPITMFSVKVVNLETIIDMQSWCKTWLPNGSRRIRAKQKLHKKPWEGCKKFLEPDRKPQVIYTDNSLEFDKACEDHSWRIIVRQHHTDQKQMGLLREQCAAWKKVRVRYCCNQVWMKNGGQIPWNAIAICGKFKISCLMGKLHTKDVLENHLKDQSFRLVLWLSMTLSLRKTSQESINLERKSYLEYSLDTLCARRRIWKGDIMVADIEELETMDASEIYAKRLNAKDVIFPEIIENSFSSRRWTNQNPWRRSGTENIHFGTGSPNSRRRSKRFSRRIRRVSTFFTTSRLTSRCWWSDKRLLVHFRKLHIAPSRWTQSQTLLAKRRIIPYSTEKYIDVSRTTHTNSDVMQESRIDDYWSIDGSRDVSGSWTGFTQVALWWSEKPPEGHTWSGGRLTKRQAASRPDHLWPELWRGMSKNA